MFYDMPKLAQTRKFHKLLVISPVLSINRKKFLAAAGKSMDILLHGPSMFAFKAKNYGVLYNQASSIAFDETSSYWSALKSS